ncbi:hypothetical protein ASD11_01740 [Aeromicrobium sp. Root495]|uniref:YbjN domain-containing protein n=1 Tax=Aeromicrobium sp. Root495 TaxID=1736550 RepID=UPI0006F83AFF|nr:YbjN domain-containing protein [Aeromicrobium sp. Root495]KQY58412.1 hypothetical protein ASD11_01740 [Aeromicrobium sp. Root495]
MTSTSDPRETILQVVRESELDHVEHGSNVIEVDLPGVRKLKTTVRLEIGRHAVGIHAFVARNPDENHEGVYRWLLEKNLKLFGVAFAIDAAGDIYLDGRIPLHAVTPEEVDRILGSVLTYSDESFNTILQLGFATSIRKEWEWRESRGESTRNLDAFQNLRPASTDDPAR